MSNYQRNFLFNMSTSDNNYSSQTQAKQSQGQAKQPISKMSLVFSDKKQPSLSFEQFRQARLDILSATDNNPAGIWSSFLSRVGRGGGCGSCSGVR